MVNDSWLMAQGGPGTAAPLPPTPHPPTINKTSLMNYSIIYYKYYELFWKITLPFPNHSQFAKYPGFQQLASIQTVVDIQFPFSSCIAQVKSPFSYY